MAQLRDARTSELIAEGTPIELALLAEQVGRENILFDGVETYDAGGQLVGEAFDPDAVIDSHHKTIDGLQAVLDAGDFQAGRTGDEQRAAVQVRLDEARRVEQFVGEQLQPAAEERLDRARTKAAAK